MEVIVSHEYEMFVSPSFNTECCEDASEEGQKPRSYGPFPFALEKLLTVN